MRREIPKGTGDSDKVSDKGCPDRAEGKIKQNCCERG
jgi:hypothetical protein